MNMLDAMFGIEHLPQKPTITEIQIFKLDPYENQPFKLYSDKQLQELADDIKENGLINPILVRPTENGRYQVIAGHNRLNAFILNRETLIPAIIREMTDSEAKIALVNSNFYQRQHISNGEKARAYKLRHEALKNQGKRGVGTALEKMARTETDSERTIARYISTNQLIPELFDRFNENRLSLEVADKLSRLSENNQRKIYEYLEQAQVDIKSHHLKLLTAEDLTHDILSETFKKRTIPILDSSNLYVELIETTDLNIKIDDFIEIIEFLKNKKIITKKIQ